MVLTLQQRTPLTLDLLGAADGVAELDEDGHLPFDATPDEVKSRSLAKPVGHGEQVFDIYDAEFGAWGDGVHDDRLAWERLRTAVDEYFADTGRRAYAYAQGGKLRGVPAAGQIAAFNLDIHKMGLRGIWELTAGTRSGSGGNTLVDPINDPSRYVFAVSSSENAETTGSPVRQGALEISGLIIDGDGVTKNMFIGRPASSTGQGQGKPARIVLDHIVSMRGSTGIEYGSYSYMVDHMACTIGLNNVGVLHNNIDQVNTDSGERYMYVGGNIHGNGLGFDLRSDQAFHFKGVSFSFNHYGGRNATGLVTLSDIHLEHNAPRFGGYFQLTGGGTIEMKGARTLIRNGAILATTLTLPTGATKVLWTRNTLGMWRVGSAFKFVTLTGTLSGIDTSTTYYMTTVDDTGFTFAATRGGSTIAWTGTGTATGIDPVGDGPMFQLDSSVAQATVHLGKHTGSSTEARYWADGPGADNFDIRGTASYNNDGLRMHTRPKGDLADGFFLGTASDRTAVLDDWQGGTSITYAVQGATSELRGDSRTLTVTCNTAAGTAAYAQLWVPIDVARAYFSYDWKSTIAAATSGSPVAIYQLGFFMNKRVLTSGSSLVSATPVNGEELWNSTLSSTSNATAWVGRSVTTRMWRRSPKAARYVLLRWDLTAAAVGDKLMLSNVLFSSL